jgi:hypothetical protein
VDMVRDAVHQLLATWLIVTDWESTQAERKILETRQ